MARLPRLVAPGRAHLLVQRAHGGAPAFVDDDDRRDFLAALGQAAETEDVGVHAYALADHEVLLLATPQDGPALGRLVQSVGRRYVGAYNRRHGRRGTLWDGRFRCGVVEPGHWTLAALVFVDALPGAVTSAGQRTGAERRPMVVDPPEFWALGNTPFDREAAYRALLVQGVPAAEAQALRHAAVGGWAVGSATFQSEMANEAGRPARPRPRGRPRLDR